MAHAQGDPGFVAWANTVDADRAALSSTFAPVPGAAQNPLTGWYHVDGYGAKGDGATDDTAAIQAAATAAVNGVLYFPKKTGFYRIGSVALPSNIEVHFAAGVGMQPLTGAPVMTATGKTNVIIHGGQHNGGGYNLGGLGLITLTNCDKSIVRDMSITNVQSTSVGILLQGCTRCRVEDTSMSGVGYGIVVGSLTANGSPTADYNVISGNTVETSVMDAIFVTSSLSSGATTNVCKGNRIVNNTVKGSTDAGIESGVNCVGTVISGNHVTGSAGPNILLRDNTAAVVANNYSAGCTATTGSYGGGIAVLDQRSISAGVIIESNICENNGLSGINLGSSTASCAVVANNICRGNTKAGILFEAWAIGTISGNLVYNNLVNGITLHASGAGPGNVTVTGNTCYDNTGDGIYIAADYTTATGNRCYSTGALQTYGIHATGTQGNFAVIVGNNCKNNAHATIDILLDGGQFGGSIAYCQGRYTQVGAA